MKEYHKKLSLKDSSAKTGTPPGAQAPLPIAQDSAVSSPALALFRLLQRLSRRTGYACVNLLETLARMLERSIRATRYALAELLAVGWIERTQTRKGGKSKLFFRPLVSVAGRSRGFFSARPVAVCVAGYSPSKLQVTPSTPIKKTPVGTEDDNRARSAGRSPEPCPVAVSLLSSLVAPHEALELAREASRQKLTEDQVKRVLAAYRGQLANIRNRGAWLREALRRGFAPAAPASDHASDNGGRPVRVIAAPSEYRKLLEAPRGGSDHRRGNPAVASPAPQPGQVGTLSGPDIVKATMAALKARRA